MTRDEAINKLVPYGSASNAMTSEAQKFIDRLEVLGLLKLDEPKSVQFEFLSSIANRIPAACVAVVNDTLAQRGLKIVRNDT